MKKILLINPLDNNPNRNTDMYPSGALLLMGTMLKNVGHQVKIIHMTSDKITSFKLKQIIRSFYPDIVGITMNTYQTKSVKNITKAIKTINKKILIVIGGPHPSALGIKIFKDFKNIDITVIGEGEHAFLEIVNGKNLNTIKGLCLKNRINPLRPLEKNLDYIPMPNLDLININNFTGVDPVGARPTMYIMASRGCPYGCIFCNKSVWGRTARFRKPEAIIREVIWLNEKYSIKEIYFTDDTFNLNRKWAERIFNLIIKHKLHKKMVFKTPFRANRELVDKKLLRLAKKAGFWMIFYGVESGSQKMLDSMNKGLTLEELRRAFKLTHETGLKTYASFIIGLPGETRETVKETYNFWKELKPFRSGIAMAIPLPGTNFREIITTKKHLHNFNYDCYSANSALVRTDDLTMKDLVNLKKEIDEKMFVSPIKRILRKVYSLYSRLYGE